MGAGTEKPLSEEDTSSRTDQEVGGDNPGIGGMPAKERRPEEDTGSRTDHETGGDNPGVGGMPAEKPVSEDDEPNERR
jgi:hypothetical protein